MLCEVPPGITLEEDIEEGIEQEIEGELEEDTEEELEDPESPEDVDA